MNMREGHIYKDGVLQTPKVTEAMEKDCAGAIAALHRIYHNIKTDPPSYNNYNVLMDAQVECQRHLYALRAALTARKGETDIITAIGEDL